MTETLATTLIDIDKIDLPADARPHDPAELESLTNDLKEEGQLQEIVAVAVNDRFEVLAGVGRVLAARKLGWSQIRASIRQGLSDFDRLRITFAENEEREDASPIYQAQLLAAMMKAKGCDQRTLAGDVGKTEAWVSQYLSLLDFSPEVRKYLTRVKFSVKQLLEICKLDGDEAQLKAAEQIAAGNLTVKETKEAVHKHLAAQGKAPKKNGTQPPAFNAGGQSFTFTRKGKNFTMVTEPPSMDGLDVFMQNTRCALVDYLNADPKAPSDAAISEKMVEPAPDPVVEGAGTVGVDTQTPTAKEAASVGA